MMKEFNRYNLAKPYNNYKGCYNMLIMEIETLLNSIENNSRYYIVLDAKRVISETFQLEGYVECLFDFGVISESDFDKFYNFIKQVRYDSNDILFNFDK